MIFRVVSVDPKDCRSLLGSYCPGLLLGSSDRSLSPETRTLQVQVAVVMLSFLCLRARILEASFQKPLQDDTFTFSSDCPAGLLAMAAVSRPFE